MPWHRIVRADGSLAKGARQRRLLEAEGVPFAGARVRMELVRVPGRGARRARGGRAIGLAEHQPCLPGGAATIAGCWGDRIDSPGVRRAHRLRARCACQCRSCGRRLAADRARRQLRPSDVRRECARLPGPAVRRRAIRRRPGPRSRRSDRDARSSTPTTSSAGLPTPTAVTKRACSRSRLLPTTGNRGCSTSRSSIAMGTWRSTSSSGRRRRHCWRTRAHAGR